MQEATMAEKRPFDSMRLNGIKRVAFFHDRPPCSVEIESIIEEGLRLNTITPEEAAHVRSIEHVYGRQEAANWIAYRNIQAGVIDGILRRAVQLDVVTPEEAASLWANMSHDERYAAAQCIARRNIRAVQKQYDDSSSD